jgi:hypothetical protein
MRTRTALAAAVGAIVLGGALLLAPHFIGGSGGTSPASASTVASKRPSPSPSPTITPALAIPAAGADSVAPPTGLTWLSWELIDRDTGKILGASANATTQKNNTESMIKSWLAADYLRRLSAAGKTLGATDTADLKRMIVLSDDKWANHYYAANGKSASVTRMDSLCKLGSTPIANPAYAWSTVQVSADQTARLAQCIADGTAAGPLTPNLLKWMTEVQGSVTYQPTPPYGPAGWGGGRWGIIDGVPKSLVAQTSIKNGWEPENYQHRWNINCLAILPHQVLAVELQYPWTTSNGNASFVYADNLQPGADGCASIASQLSTTK